MDGHPADFVFVERRRRLGATRFQRGLGDAVVAAGLTGPGATRCGWLPNSCATELANAGMSM